jgi:excisionase family DNA binding protein
LVLLKPTEVAHSLGVSRSWLYKAVAAGCIPYVRLGGEHGPLRFVQADLDEWLDDARRAWKPGDRTATTLRAAPSHRRAADSDNGDDGQ